MRCGCGADFAHRGVFAAEAEVVKRRRKEAIDGKGACKQGGTARGRRAASPKFLTSARVTCNARIHVIGNTVFVLRLSSSVATACSEREPR